MIYVIWTRGARGLDNMSSKGLVKRRYLQATAVKHIVVLLPNDNAEKSLTTRSQRWHGAHTLNSRRFCGRRAVPRCSEIVNLLRLVRDRLHENIPQQNNPREIHRDND
jgi:hypothetical protein